MSTNITRYSWGWSAGPADADRTLVVVMGQHGDERRAYEGGEAVEAMLWDFVQRLPFSRPVPGGSELPEDLADVAVYRAETVRWVDVSRVRVVCTHALNPAGLVAGTRRYGCTVLSPRTVQGGVDLNRCWPREHPVVAEVWDVVVASPGEVVVVDVHGTTADRWGDERPDTHVFAGARGAVVAREAAPDMPVVPDMPGVVGTLQQAAEAAGFAGITLEISEEEPHPAVVACRFVRAVLATLAGR